MILDIAWPYPCPENRANAEISPMLRVFSWGVGAKRREGGIAHLKAKRNGF